MEKDYKKVPIEENEKFSDPDEREPAKYGYGVRHVQALLCFMCIALGYIARGHMGVTIVAMTIVKHDVNTSICKTDILHAIDNNTDGDLGTIPEGCVFESNDTVTNVNNMTDMDRTMYKTYDWPKSIQETIQGSFFLGYSIMMFPIGLVCQRWGGKVPLQLALFVNGVVSILTPWFVAWGGWKALCVIRVLQGLSQSGLYPATHTVLANWVPVSERGSITSYVFTASGIGTVIAFQLSGILASSRFGWPSTFWVIGVTCLIGFILITFFGSTNLKEHKSITEAEKMYIMGKVGNSTETKPKVPWKSVAKSVPVWATCIAHTGNALCFVFFFMQVPTYMYAVLKFDVRSSGILSSLPYLMSCFSSISYGYLSDFLTNRKIVSLKTARKIFNTIGSIIPSLCLCLVAYTTNTTLAVTCFVLYLTANAAIHTGWMINYIDLSPNFSGALMATGNTMANLLVLALPVIVSNIVTDVTNQNQWRITMLLMAALTTGVNFIFVLFMSADVQPWNDGDDNDVNIEEPEAVKLDSNNMVTAK